MTRLALVTQDWPGFVGGGVATLSWVLAEGLAEVQTPAEVWTRGGGARTGRARPGPLPIRAFDGRSWRRRGRGHWALGVATAAAAFAPTRVVCTTWDPVPGVLDALPSGVEVSCFAFGRDVTGTLDGRRKAERAAAWADPRVHWLTLTAWMRSELLDRGVPPTRVRQVSPAVSEPPVYQRPDRPLHHLLTVGRLVARKGQDRTIEALAALRDELPEITYSIVGEGPDRDRLRALVRRHELEDRVTLRGRLVGVELEAAFAAADLFVMPARVERGGDTEGYGLVYLEAGARGLPVIGGRTAGAAEAVDHGATGLLVGDPNDAAQVASAIRQALRSSTRLASWGAEGRRRFEQTARPRHFARAVMS